MSVSDSSASVLLYSNIPLPCTDSVISKSIAPDCACLAEKENIEHIPYQNKAEALEALEEFKNLLEESLADYWDTTELHGRIILPFQLHGYDYKKDRVVSTYLL